MSSLPVSYMKRARHTRISLTASEITLGHLLGLVLHSSKASTHADTQFHALTHSAFQVPQEGTPANDNGASKEEEKKEQIFFMMPKKHQQKYK